jgi:hypothetical protein
MLPHAQGIVSMQHVAQKHLCHTASHKEKQPEPKKQRASQPVLWCPVNCHTHIKEITRKQQTTKEHKTKNGKEN